MLVLQLPLRELGFAILSGAPEVEQAGRAYFNARVWGAPATLCNFVLVLATVFAAPRLLLGALTSHQELVELSLRYAPWLIPTVLLGGLAYMYDGLYLGLTAGRALRRSMLISLLVFFLPPALIAIRAESNHLLWLAMMLFMVGRTVTLGLAYPALLRRFASE